MSKDKLFECKNKDEMKKLFTERLAENGIKYVIDNINRLEDFEIDSLERDLKRKHLTELSDVYVDRDGGVSNTNIKLNLLLPLNELLSKIEQEIGSSYGDIDFDAWNNLGYVVKQNYLRHKKGNTFTSFNLHPADLVSFLIYITEGKVEKDRKRGLDFAEGIEGSFSRFEPNNYEFVFNGVKVKQFKNGRLDMKFPKKKHLELAIKTLEDFAQARAKK